MIKLFNIWSYDREKTGKAGEQMAKKQQQIWREIAL